MGVIATAAKHLIAAGITGDALVMALHDIESASIPQRSKAAIRQERYRERKENERNEASQNVTSDAKKEIPPTPPKEKNKKNITTNAREGSGIVSRETISARGARLTDDWRPPPDYIAFALTEGFSEAEAYREADRFRDYWVSKTGQQACKRDWFATWRNWIRNARDRRRDAGKQDAPRVVDYLREVQNLPEDDPDCWREPLPDRGQRQIGR